jgi:hypothetical protein
VKFNIADQLVFQAENNPLYRFPVNGIVRRVAKEKGGSELLVPTLFNRFVLDPYSGIVSFFDGLFDDPQHVGFDGVSVFEGVHL